MGSGERAWEGRRWEFSPLGGTVVGVAGVADPATLPASPARPSPPRTTPCSVPLLPLSPLTLHCQRPRSFTSAYSASLLCMAFYSPAQHPLLRQNAIAAPATTVAVSADATASASVTRQHGAVATQTNHPGGAAGATGVAVGVVASVPGHASVASASSSAIYGDEEWVLFSAGESSSFDVDIDEVDDDEDEEIDDIDEDNDEQEFDDKVAAPVPIAPGSNHYADASTRLRHDASYLSATPSALATPTPQRTLAALSRSAASSYSSDEITARINAWRIDQSEQLFRELRRHHTRAANRRSSSISSWGIPAEEEDETDDRSADADGEERYYEDNETDDSRAQSSRGRMLYASRAALADLGASESFARISLAESYRLLQEQQSIQQQQQQQQQRSVQLSAASHRIAGRATGQPPYFAGDAAAADGTTATTSGGLWQRITRRVIHDIMGLNDDVLDVLFGDRFMDPTADVIIAATERTSTTSAPPAAGSTEDVGVRRQSCVFSEKSSGSVLSSISSKKYWEDKLMARISRELTTRYCRDYGSVEICTGLFV
ncbi:uncharacterized protein V1518DRAFT_420227 [Limtongia smithiae]|uniref:uncharacterized protein n=1 Tax=Limtongia smithiae TaxID=1125753 RepID=UPI0034CE7002